MSHITHFYALAALDYVMGPPMSPWVPYFGSGAGAVAVSANPGGWDRALSAINYPSGYQNSFKYYVGYLKPGAIGPFDILGLNSAAGVTGSVVNGYLASGVLAELKDQKTVWSKVIADYVVALHIRRRALEVGAQFAGGLPHFRSLVMGGVAVDATSATIQNWINTYKDVLYRGSATINGTTGSPASATVLGFIKNNYLPLVNIVSYLYPAYDNPNNTGLGGAAGQDYGAGWGNFLGYGVFPSHLPGAYNLSAESSMVSLSGSGPYRLSDFLVNVNDPNAKRFHNRGYVSGGTSSTPGALYSPTSTDISNFHRRVVEVVDYSWYYYYNATGTTAAPSAFKHPWDGYTDPVRSSTAKAGAYTWAKGPRIWHNYPNSASPVLLPMQVGPLARMWVTGLYRGGMSFRLPLDHASLSANLAPAGLTGNRTVAAGHATMDRHRARALEAYLIGVAAAKWLEALSSGSIISQDSYTPKGLPSNASGFGIHEAPRGALGHWVLADAQRRIQNWQAVVPSTWIDSPKDYAGQHGPLEKSILSPTLTYSGEKSLDFKKQYVDVPVEVLRVIHSYDPCLACTVHVIEKDGEKGVRKR